MLEKNPRAMIAMSGGVDSSAAAFLARERGYDCMGVMLRLFDNAGAGLSEESGCCSQSDAEDARAVAAALRMPFYVFNFTDAFRERVMLPFAECYLHGHTPNPCIACNRHMKFGLMLDRARLLGCDVLVTGHYARIEEYGGRFHLLRAADESKDQSYVLYNLTQEQLSHVMFPLGGMSKGETRRLAGSLGLVTARKRDSQDICFAPDGDYAAAIARCTGRTCPEGNFVDESGNVLGRHRGIVYYTVGQRRGLGVSAAEPLYVQDIRPQDNTVVLSRRDGLFSRELYAADFNWVSGRAPERPVRVQAKIRYRHEAQPAFAESGPDGTVRVAFDEPQRAITRGQSVVLYDRDELLGGGIIQ